MNDLRPAAPEINRLDRIKSVMASLEATATALNMFANGIEEVLKSVRILLKEFAPDESESEVVTIYDGFEPEVCCTDGCCGPGSWCCSRANPHEHDEDTGDLIDKARADKAEQDMLADEERS